jgi:four helix bundle protein
MFKHEDLHVYQKSLDYSVSAVHMSKRLTRGYYPLADQLLRASTSIPLNIAEGNGKWHIKERVNHFRIARASAFECVAILDILAKLELIDKSEQTHEKERLQEIGKMLSALCVAAER